jgi:hypothetical protein
MRTTLLSALMIVIGAAALAQAATTPDAVKVQPPGRVGSHPSYTRCCHEKVWDSTGREIGDLISYDERFQSQQLGGWVAYHVKGGDGVPILVYPQGFYPVQNGGGSTSLFTTPDCSGNAMFAIISSPPLAKRYGIVLNAGYPFPTGGTHAWLFVTDPLPTPVVPGPGTVFHSQWSDTGACAPYPAPGYTVTSQPGGYWTHREVDLLAIFHRPFYIDY